MDLLTEHLAKGLGLALLLSIPPVLVAAGVGLVIGILQAVTQVQEQTISAAPKILSVFAILLLGGGLMMNMLMDYIREAAVVAFQEIPQSSNFILPPRQNDETRSRVRAFFKAQASGKTDAINQLKTIPGFGAEEAVSPGGLGVQTVRPGNPLQVSERMSLDKQQQKR